MMVCQIIVTYNRAGTVLRTLLYLNEQSHKADYIVVVNNGSSDGTKEELNSFDLFKIYPIHLPDNLGFGYGLSQGMKFGLTNFSDIGYFLLMDDDSHPDKDFLKQLLNARVAVSSSGIIGTMGYVDDVWNGPVPVNQLKNKAARLIANSQNIYTVDHVLVDGALIDKSVVDQIGTLREDVFMMCEDREYCARIRKAGYSITVLENELMNRLHLGGGVRFSFNTRWRGYYHARNHLMIVKEYFTFKLLIMYIIRQLKYLVAAIAAPDRKDRIRLRLLGMYHGMIGKMGKTIDPQSYPRK